MKWHVLLVGLLALLQTGSCASADERDEVLYARYVKVGVQAGEIRFHPDYPSEKEALAGLVSRVAVELQPGGYDIRQRPYLAEARLDRPIVVRTFGARQTAERSLYYYCIPLVHGQWGVADVYTYKRYYDSVKGGAAFSEGGHGGIGGSPGRPLYLMRAEEAKRLAEERLGIRVARMPMAVSVYVSNLQTRGNNTDWFWYLRAEPGLEVGSKAVLSVFVSPFCLAADPNNVTAEELAAEPRLGRSGLVHVNIRNRFYTYLGDDLDLYALDEAQRKAGDAPLSRDKASALYLPERINFAPIVLESSSSAETE